MAGSVIAAQLYTVREFTKTPDDLATTLKKVADIGYEAVQLSAVCEMDPADLRKLADDAGVTICATHIGYQQMADDPQGVIAMHQAYGCTYAGIGGLPGEYRSAEGFAQFAKDASETARRLAEGGIRFVYHNHNFELEKFGDRTGLQILYEDSDPAVFLSEIDTYWVQAGGGSPAAWLKKTAGRIPIIHFKDMAFRDGQAVFAEIGEGNLDWPTIIAAAQAGGCEYAFIEQDDCYDRTPLESLEISYRNLVAMGLS